MTHNSESKERWYEGITRYQWLVLLIASLGWIFDVFEGQIFVASMKDAMPALLPKSIPPDEISGAADYYNNIALAAFLVGGALGGVFFGILSDKIGRSKTMIYTILVYSFFTCTTAFVTDVWQLIVLRFFVALGVGGEWAVASAMVSEVFPKKARAWSGAIFHASSVFGTYLAVLAGIFVLGNEKLGADAWRWAFAIGAFPALLTVWIRWKLKEPERWVEAQSKAKETSTQPTGSIRELASNRELRKYCLLGVALAAIGLATFWGVSIQGRLWFEKSAQRELNAVVAEAPEAEREQMILDAKPSIKRAEMIGMFLWCTGGGIGLLCFGPLASAFGRKRAFYVYHAGGFGIAMLLYHLEAPSQASLYVLLPAFGFLTMGMHAGYAIYFPELFPTRLRGTGAGICFNVGRIVAAPILVLKGLMRDRNFSEADTGIWLSWLFLLAFLILAFLPETKNRDLPD